MDDGYERALDQSGAGRGYAYAITGTAADPTAYPGKRSHFRAYEEAMLEELVRR